MAQNPLVAPRFTTIFTVVAMNDDSCQATDTATVIVLHQPSQFIPTAFTPNGDGMNDRFEFDILGATHVDITIFTRWGDVVYHNDSQNNGLDCVCGWDGLKGGKILPFDTYVYKMKVTFFDDKTKDITGTVAIMK
ncbi:MAG: gliding motility-associated C-terminal domain-containing protein [Bacteroidetes bacterium]|nr:gliding motility-associated C-terminal domain-containing protein [Bacteroidota bacterium]